VIMVRLGLSSTVIVGFALGGLVTVAVRTSARVIAQSAQSVPSTPERLAEMRHHFKQVMLMHEAVIRGDLPAARETAKELAQIPVPPGVPASSTRYVAAIREAGQSAAAATTLALAAMATVSMVSECANCHRAVGVLPAPSTPSTPDVGGLVGHMLEHKRAADEMLQGLLIPSASRWRQGAERLRVAPLHPSQLPPNRKFTEEMRRAENRIHQIADQAVDAETPAARESAYVQLLTSCADCHRLHRIWGPRTGR
jgi:hypothetical protein